MNFFERMKLRAVMMVLAVSVALAGTSAHAQEQSEAQKKADKEFNEFVEKEVSRLEGLLKLEDWQVFYVDSIMRHDLTAMMAEFEDLKKKKVSQTDTFVAAQDKWQEQMYNAYREVFDDQQWAKYLKSGAAREKKSRDKRAKAKND